MTAKLQNAQLNASHLLFSAHLYIDLGFYLLQLEFTPSPNGSYQFATVNPHYFNKFGCDGVFKNIESKTAEDLVEEIKNALRELNDAPTPRVGGSDDQLSRSSQKRPLTPIFTAGSSLSGSKKQKGDSQGETGQVKSIQERCNACQLDSKCRKFHSEEYVIITCSASEDFKDLFFLRR